MTPRSSQQIGALYQANRKAEVAFTRAAMEASGLDPAGSFLRVGGTQLPCVITSSTLESARVIVSLTPEARERLRDAGASIALRFRFVRADEENPISFFVPAKVAALQPYKGTTGPASLLLLAYPNQPPDDLIVIVSELVEAGRDVEKRRDQRLTITRESEAALGLVDRNAELLAGGTGRQGVLHDVSLGGASLIVASEPPFAAGSAASLRLRLRGLDRPVEILGMAARAEKLPMRPDHTLVAVSFDLDSVPLAYRVRLVQALQRSPGPGR
jgi:hypothetical protein